MKLILGNKPCAAGTFSIFANPVDFRAPFRLEACLPGGRNYEGRLRAHASGKSDDFWYEGFVVAMDARGYARDTILQRYPSPPLRAPRAWDLLPCQLKLNALNSPKTGNGPVLIGSLWVSVKGHPGGEIFKLLGWYCTGYRPFGGTIARYSVSRIAPLTAA